MSPFKPGCFSSPLCYGDQTLPCTRCPFRAECGPAAEAVAHQLRQTYRIEDAFGAARKPKVGIGRTAIASATTANSPHRALLRPVTRRSELEISLERRGICLKQALADRVNPFESQPPRHMRVIFGLLLAGGFTRAEVKQSLMTDLGWSEASAASNASAAIAAMLDLGAAQDEGGRLVPVQA